MFKAITSAVLAVVLIAGTAIAQDEEVITFREALTEYTVATALVDAAFENASFNNYEGISMQALTDEVGATLDNWQSLVVESCASQWYTVVEVWWMLYVSIFREADAETQSTLVESMQGLGTLMSYYQTNATIACGLGEG